MSYLDILSGAPLFHGLRHPPDDFDEQEKHMQLFAKIAFTSPAEDVINNELNDGVLHPNGKTYTYKWKSVTATENEYITQVKTYLDSVVQKLRQNGADDEKVKDFRVGSISAWMHLVNVYYPGSYYLAENSEMPIVVPSTQDESGDYFAILWDDGMKEEDFPDIDL